MFDTEYNRKISQQIEDINRKYITHARKIGLGTQKGLLRVVGSGEAMPTELINSPVMGAVGGVRRRRVGRAISGEESTELEGESIFNKEMLGEGKTTKGNKTKAKKGKGFWDTLETVAQVALPLLALGKPKKTTASKKVPLSTEKNTVITEDMMGGKKNKRVVSPWITHVKAFAKKHKMKYNEALKNPKCKETYKKM